MLRRPDRAHPEHTTRARLLRATSVAVGLLALPAVAHAGGIGVELEGGVAVPLTTPQSTIFDVGGEESAKLRIDVKPYLDVGPSASFTMLPAAIDGDQPGVVWGLGAGLRLKRPHDRDSARGVSPWVDFDALYMRTGALNRAGFSAGLGVSWPIGVDRRYWLGPFVRYTQTVQLERAGYDNRDAKLLTVGLSLEIGSGRVGGVALATASVWSFTTGACSLAPITLGGAGRFGVLGGPTVTSTGQTIVTGDIGSSPGAAIIGFPPGIIVGARHAADPISAQGEADLTTAYNEAAGLSLCPITESGNLGGLTLAPGLYKSTSSLDISSGDLTLDAQGDVNAVWVFQIASTLTTTAGRQVILAGGAKASNVFWQVGTSATIGTTSAFKGTIMADQSVTLLTGATLVGRALARIAAVTLDANMVTVPAP